MKHLTTARDAVIYLGNDFNAMQEKSRRSGDTAKKDFPDANGFPNLVDTAPSLIADTPPAPANHQERHSPTRDDFNGGAADA